MVGITRRHIIQNAAAFAALGSSLPLFSKTARAGAKTIRIGALQALSGHQSAYGQETLPAVEFMVKKINAAGGIKSMGGAQLELVVADTASMTAQAGREARRLITQEKVDIIVGGLITNEFVAIANILDEYKVPAVSFLSGGAPSPYAYSLGFSYDDGYAGSMCDFAAYLRDETDIPMKRIALVNPNYEGGQQIGKYLRERAEKLKFEIVSETFLDMKSQDMLAPLLKLRSAKPDAIIGLQIYPQLLALMQARYQLKYYDSVFIGTLGNADIRFRQDLGPQIAKEVLSQGVYGMALYAPSAKIEALHKIGGELQGKDGIGHKFGQYSIPTVQTIRVVQHALESAGTSDKEALQQALQKVVLPVGHPDLYLPYELSFTADRVLTRNRSMMVQWSNEAVPEPVVVYPNEFASAKPRKNSSQG